MSVTPRAAATRRSAAIRVLALGAVLLLAISSACNSEPEEPTATTPPAATATSIPADVLTPAYPSATDAPASGLEPDATVSGALAASPTTPPTDPTEAPTAAPAATAAPVGINVGNTLPHFELTLVDGSKVSTEVLAAQGRPVFLYFFTTW